MSCTKTLKRGESRGDSGVVWLVPAFVMGIFLWVVFTTPVLAQSQTWYLTGEDSDSNKVMYKGSSPGSGDVTIPHEGEMIWIANVPASEDTEFPKKSTWSGHIECDAAESPENWSFGIGTWDGSQFVAEEWGEFDSSGDWTLTGGSFVVPAGDYLAYRIHDDGWANEAITISVTGSDSYLTAPDSTPLYPVPDTAAWLSFGAGLVVLGLIIWWLKVKGPVTTRAS